MHDFEKEIFYKTARSGGKGGQNVNKVETMAEAWWLVADSQAFTSEEKEHIAHKLANKISKDGYIVVKCSETRSQLENKQIALRKLLALVRKSLVIPKKRKPTKISKAIKEARLQSKKRESQKKEMRRKNW